jgi:hypothetical protein
MVKGGEYRLRDYTPDLLDGAAESVFLKSEARTGTFIAGSVSLEDPAKVEGAGAWALLPPKRCARVNFSRSMATVIEPQPLRPKPLE